jgi:hypothetical protein
MQIVHLALHGHRPAAFSPLQVALFVPYSPDCACLQQPVLFGISGASRKFPYSLLPSMWPLVGDFLLPPLFFYKKLLFRRPETQFSLLFKPARRRAVSDRLSQPSVDCFATLNLSSVSALHEKYPTTLNLFQCSFLSFKASSSFEGPAEQPSSSHVPLYGRVA